MTSCSPQIAASLIRSKNEEELLLEKVKQIDGISINSFIPFSKYEASVKKMNNEGVIFVNGGDGTLNYAINKLSRAGLLPYTKLCYLPSGTGNDFARNIGLLELQETEILNLVASNSFANYHLGQIDDDLFINVASFGMFGDVTPQADEALKDATGGISYYLEALSRVTSVQSWNLQLSIDGQKPIQATDAIGFFVSNSCFAGAGLRVSPDANPKEKKLDLLKVEQMPISSLVSLAASLQIPGSKIDHPGVFHSPISSLKIKADRPLPYTRDGESGSTVDSCISLSKQQVKIFSPKH